MLNRAYTPAKRGLDISFCKSIPPYWTDPRQGEYFKYLDELVISLDGFKIVWEHRKWAEFPLREALWAMYLYTELYVCAFSFVSRSRSRLTKASACGTCQNAYSRHKPPARGTAGPVP